MAGQVLAPGGASGNPNPPGSANLGRGFWPSALEYQQETLSDSPRAPRSKETWISSGNRLHSRLVQWIHQASAKATRWRKDLPPQMQTLLAILEGEGTSALHSQLERWGFRFEQCERKRIYTLTSGQPKQEGYAQMAVTVDSVSVSLVCALIRMGDEWSQTIDLSREGRSVNRNELTRTSL